MEVLSKDMITRWILPLLPARTSGRRATVDPAEVVGAICYKLKTGCQWRWLPVKALFTGEPLSWQGVYYHFNTWGKQGVWKNYLAQQLASASAHPRLVQHPTRRQPHAG